MNSGPCSSCSEVGELRADVKRLLESSAGMSAKLDALAETKGVEVQALFEARRLHEVRLTEIEKSYWPRADQQRFEAVQDEDLRDVKQEVADVRRTVQRWSGAIALIAIAVPLIAKFVL